MKFAIAFAAAALASTSALAQDWSQGGTAGQPAISWDQWGVPHIEAASDEDAAFALGWAQARGRPDQLVELLVQSRGTAASLWGEEYVESDMLIATSGLQSYLPGLMAELEPAERANVEAFAQGINAYFAANPGALSAERARGLPISAEDVIAHAQNGIYLTFVAPRELARAQQLRAAAAESREEIGERGPNGWAVGPSRSASGNAMLLMNPHLPWDGVFTWFESHVMAEGDSNYGVSLLGHPQANIMFNEHLGWTHTVNRLDNADMYRVELTPGGGYIFDGAERRFDASQHMLRVAMPDGSVAERPMPILRTVHGPVVARDATHAYALRLAGFGNPDFANTFAQYAAMADAEDREEFEAALARLQNPMFNTIYADGDGEILYVSNGLHPVRSTGDAAFWDEVVDGSTSATLWTDYHEYDSLLRVANPASGFVQNANETGYTATYPIALDPADYPADWIPPDMRTRPQHSIELLTADTSITFEEFIDYSHSTRLVFAENTVDNLVAIARADGREEAVRAAEVLENWNRRTDADSRGAVLFFQWAYAMFNGPGFEYDREWAFDDPANFSTGIQDALEPAAVETLVQIVRMADERGIPLDLPWGAFARIEDDEGNYLPSSQGPGGLGAFRVGNFSPQTGQHDTSINGATGWVAAIEFDDIPRAKAILPYGNFAQRPDGIESQYPLLSEGRLRDVNFTPEAVRAATVFGEVLERD
ncbi:MAG: penicillin acylase family protein [Alteraurantiacibacter sp.]